MRLYTDVDTFPASITEIEDSDPPNATNLNTAFEGVANRTRWLKNRAGVAYFERQTLSNVHDNPLFTGSSLASWASMSRQPDTDGYQVFSIAQSGLLVGDIVRFTMTGNLTHSGNDGAIFTLEGYYKNANGHATYASLPGAVARWHAPLAGVMAVPFSFSGDVVISALTGNLLVAISGSNNSGSNSFDLVGSYSAHYSLLRGL